MLSSLLSEPVAVIHLRSLVFRSAAHNKIKEARNNNLDDKQHNLQQKNKRNRKLKIWATHTSNESTACMNTFVVKHVNRWEKIAN